jgi:hypothetical protein
MVRPIERFVAGRSRGEAGELHVLASLAHANVRWRPSLPGIRSGPKRGVRSLAGVSLPLGLGSVPGSRGRIPGDFGRWRWGGKPLHERDPPGSAAKTCRCRGIPCHPQEAEQARSGLQKESGHIRWGLCAARFTLRSLSSRVRLRLESPPEPTPGTSAAGRVARQRNRIPRWRSPGCGAGLSQALGRETSLRPRKFQGSRLLRTLSNFAQ